jgi:predicted Zn-dependent protease
VSQAAATLGSLRYRRRDEQAADREGLRLLQAARVSPDGMLTFFTRLAGRRDDRASAVMDYLSTHPRSAARAEALRTRAEGTAYEPSPVLDAAGWDALRRVCADAS